MKKIFYAFSMALFALASLQLQSCSKGEYNSGDKQIGTNPFYDDGKPKEIPSGKFSAVVNEVKFDATYSNAYWKKIDSSNKEWYMVGYTNANNKEGFTLITKTNSIGTYTVGTDNTSISYKATGSSVTVNASSGEIKITKLSETSISGEFTMTGPGGFDVKEGTFELPIVTMPN